MTPNLTLAAVARIASLLQLSEDTRCWTNQTSFWMPVVAGNTM